ncbi:hypothetical protein KDL45_03760 [bacterium]|nr:hypothetical protein [bacterium]
MKRVEMVRCRVQSPDSDPGDDATLRYVPFEIFRLWRYLMEEVKGFRIEAFELGLWVDEEMASRNTHLTSGVPSDPVMEVSFTYGAHGEVGRPVIRYFPKDSFERIMQIFLRNFRKENIHGATRQVQGYFLPVDDDEASPGASP